MTLYVAPEGKDSWSGSLAKANVEKTDGPFASLQGARDALRHLPLTGPVRVVVEEGEYTLKEPLVLGPEDSGTADAPITYEAAPKATPVFSGGVMIRGFQRGADGIWSATVPEVRDGKWYFEQLWVNGHRAVRARTPNKFYSYMAGKVTQGIDPLTGKEANLASRAFRAYPDDLKPLLALSPTELQDVTVVVYHSWEISRLPVAAVDAQTNTLITAGPSAWNFMEWAPRQRYHVV